MTKVEQIIGENVILDFDERLSGKELLDELSKDLPICSNKNPYDCIIDGVKIQLFVKQITYLGNPHKIFKKRIQISKGWEEQLKNDNSYLIGVYKYKSTFIYTFFNKDNYINRNTNNSSAHISTFDLLTAQKEGIFTKKDIRGNIITTVHRKEIKGFFEALINKKETKSDEILLFDKFKRNLNQKYYGKDCYREMVENNYTQKFHPEWIAFYLEYKFQTFLDENPDFKKICHFQVNKKRNDIDLDLNFNNKYLGDLKVHSNNSTSVLGNDSFNIERALDEFGKIWYVVFNHNTEKDSLFNFEVTKFWNTLQNKENLMSYSSKMKNNITFTDFKILEINTYNKKYLSVFNQGKNSKTRKPKIKIDKSTINNFLIYHNDF